MSNKENIYPLVLFVTNEVQINKIPKYIISDAIESFQKIGRAVNVTAFPTQEKLVVFMVDEFLKMDMESFAAELGNHPLLANSKDKHILSLRYDIDYHFQHEYNSLERKILARFDIIQEYFKSNPQFNVIPYYDSNKYEITSEKQKNADRNKLFVWIMYDPRYAFNDDSDYHIHQLCDGEIIVRTRNKVCVNDTNILPKIMSSIDSLFPYDRMRVIKVNDKFQNIPSNPLRDTGERIMEVEDKFDEMENRSDADDVYHIQKRIF